MLKSNLAYARRSANGKKGYMPDELVSNYMGERLHFERRREQEKLRGTDLSEDKTYLNLKKRKTDVLRRIFTSEANLIFFFECIAKHEELQRVFEDDLLDLLGLKRDSPELNRPGYIVSRLIRSMLIWSGTQGISSGGVLSRLEYEKTGDFQMILTDICQQAINDKVRMSLPSVIDREPNARKNVLKDFDTVRGWTKMLGHTVDQEMLIGLPSRTLDFSSTILAKKTLKRINLDS
jgi:hypothetical protein